MLRNLFLVILFFLPLDLYSQVGIDTKFWDWTETNEHHKSVVRVIGKAGNIENHGSGVVIAENKVLTAFHVIEGSTTYFIDLGEKRVEFLLGPVDARNDVCVLVSKEKLELPAVIIAKKVAENSIVEVCGFGGGGPLRHFSAELRLFSGDKIGVDAYVIPGDSGGPVFNSDKELVGIVSGGISWSLQTVVSNKNGQMKATWPIRCGSLTVIEGLLRK